MFKTGKILFLAKGLQGDNNEVYNNVNLIDMTLTLPEICGLQIPKIIFFAINGRQRLNNGIYT